MAPPSDKETGHRDISNLTVPRLKILCKEHRLTGYSKLGKSAPIDKLKLEGPQRAQAASNPIQLFDLSRATERTVLNQIDSLDLPHTQAAVPPNLSLVASRPTATPPVLGHGQNGASLIISTP